MQVAKNLKNPKIYFREVVPDMVPDVQAKADVFLLPLRKWISKTATPSKLTAYLFSAKPIIASVEKDSDVANILIKNHCGFIVEPENIELLSNKMKDVYKMQIRQLREMGENGKEYAKNNLSRTINLNKVEVPG